MKKTLLCIMLLGLIGNFTFAQEEVQKRTICYIGPGMGLDYGGIFGAKIEVLPIKYFGLFAGGGYTLLSFGWNVGGTVKILPDKKVSPNLMCMYGYNAVLFGMDSYSKKYNMTSYGVTAGINIDIKIGEKNKLTPGLFVPFRSQKFKDNYEKAENDPNMSLTPLWPIGMSVGFNFGIQ